MLRRTNNYAIVLYIKRPRRFPRSEAPAVEPLSNRARIAFGWRNREMPFPRPDRKDESHGRHHHHQDDLIDQARVQRIGVRISEIWNPELRDAENGNPRRLPRVCRKGRLTEM